MLDVTFTETLPHAVLLSRLQSIGSIVEGDLLVHARLVVNIEDVVVLARIEVLVARVVLGLGDGALAALVVLGDDLAYLLPLCVLPHEGLGDQPIAEHPDFALLLPSHFGHVGYGLQFRYLLRAHA